MTPGYVIIPVNSGDEARRICERLVGRTYTVDNGGALQVFPDRRRDWFHRLAWTMSREQFWARFGPGTQPQAVEQQPVSIFSTIQQAVGFGAVDEIDDPHRETREALPTLEAVEAARQRATEAAAKLAEASDKVEANFGDRRRLEPLAAAAGAAAEALRQMEIANGQRRMYAPTAMGDAHRRTVTEMTRLTTARKVIIAKLRSNFDERPAAREMLESTAKNVGLFAGKQVKTEHAAAQSRMRSLDVAKARLLDELAANEADLRAAHEQRWELDNQICDFVDCPRREAKSIESILIVPAFVDQFEELAAA